MCKKPNLFADYATSELSQDAFICWLIAWAQPVYKQKFPELNQTACRFLDALFKSGGETPPDCYDSVKIQRQFDRIDILVRINNKYLLLIEDKVDAHPHGDQLQCYLTHISEKSEQYTVIPIYFKTGNQSNYEEVLDTHYSCFLRPNLLEVLDFGNNLKIQNDIFSDYRDHLHSMEDEFQSFRTLPVKDWPKGSRLWEGFFSEIQDRFEKQNPFGNLGWGWVNNASGGFIALWWAIKKDDSRYIQLEYDKLCFKISLKGLESASELRNEWFQILTEECDQFDLKIDKPARFGTGYTMTSAISVDGYIKTDQEGMIDIDRTIDILTRAQELHRHALQEL